MLSLKAIKPLISFLLILFLTAGLIQNVFSQEIVVPLHYNNVLRNAALKTSNIPTRTAYDTFNLLKHPFFDDFNQQSHYPIDSLWIDQHVFINNTMGYLPPSIGVATFDGLDKYGYPYYPNELSSSGYTCDTLTSVPIDLHTFVESDSIYLSFFYQPQGLGDPPESLDSLVLEYKPDRYWTGYTWDSTAWIRLWRVSGTPLKPFKQVILPVKHYYIIPAITFDTIRNDDTISRIDTIPTVDTVGNFYHNAFQFRFMNYGNQSGNLDIWNLDYVYLNKSRSRSDTNYKDEISVVAEPQSLLDSFTAMPWSHLLKDTTFFRNNYYMLTRCLDTVSFNVTGKFYIVNEKNYDTLIKQGNLAQNIYPDSAIDYTICNTVQKNFPFTTVGGDTVVLKSINNAYITQDKRQSNNTSSRIQTFSNYYAYDDGTAEAGYGVDIGSYLIAKVAYRFRTPADTGFFKGDSLRGLWIYFNQSLTEVGNQPFNILVWNNFSKDYVIRNISAYTPGFKDSINNGFYLYIIHPPVPLDSCIDHNKYEFYVGWEQNTAYIMNVGLDMNYCLLNTTSYPKDSIPDVPNANIFYYTAHQWNKSEVCGALMMRPVISSYPISIPNSILDTSNDYLSVHKNLSTSPICKVYPNPASNYLKIETNQDGIMNYLLYDITGKEMLSGKINRNATLDISNFYPGFYMIKIFDNQKNNAFIGKIIVN